MVYANKKSGWIWKRGTMNAEADNISLTDIGVQERVSPMMKT